LFTSLKLEAVVNATTDHDTVAFDAVTRLVGYQEEHLARKKQSDEVLVWLFVWSEVQMICIRSS